MFGILYIISVIISFSSCVIFFRKEQDEVDENGLFVRFMVTLGVSLAFPVFYVLCMVYIIYKIWRKLVDK